METKDQLKVDENVEVNLITNQPIPEKREYEVVSEAGLFKQGKQYAKGDMVELNNHAAKNFLANGDIKEVE